MKMRRKAQTKRGEFSGCAGQEAAIRHSRFLTCAVRILGFLALLYGGFSCPRPVRAVPQSASEIKATYILNFIKFSEWPPDALAANDAYFVIGVLGSGPSNGDMDRNLNGKVVAGRTLVVKHFIVGQELRECKLLFVSASEKRQLARILDSIRGATILTISEIDQFANNGGIINFFIEENKLRFEINVDAASRARIRISSKVLQLARIIKG
jgi:hypothetical protein